MKLHNKMLTGIVLFTACFFFIGHSECLAVEGYVAADGQNTADNMADVFGQRAKLQQLLQDYQKGLITQEQFKKSQEKPTTPYVPCEIIVKFKSKEALSSMMMSGNSQGTITPAFTDTLMARVDQKTDLKLQGDEIKQVNGLPQAFQTLVQSDTVMEPVFKNLHNQLKSTHQTEDAIMKQLFQKLSSKRKLNATDSKKYNFANVYVVKNIRSTKSIKELCSELSRDPHVEYAEPNLKVKALMVPNDPFYRSSGSWGQPYQDLWGLQKLQCEGAWNITQGRGAVVAVIDTGVDYNHEDLAVNIWTNADEIAGNGIDDDGNGYVDDVHGYDFANYDADPMDDFGHGTHCAGTIAAVGNNGKGIIGVAPQATIMPVKGLDENGSGYSDALAACIRYAVDNGADVLSNSWGGYGVSELLIDTFHYASDAGCVSIAAAGNSSMDVRYFKPANIDTVIAVAASNQEDRKCDFSNFGEKIDVSAPGGDSETGDGNNYWGRNILSLRSDNNGNPTDMYQDNVCIVADKYYRSRGTSMACPHVAGVAALLVSQAQGQFLNKDIAARLITSADPIDSLNEEYRGLLGRGRINAYKALTQVPIPIIEIPSARTEHPLQAGTQVTMQITVRNKGGIARNVIGVLGATGANQSYIQFIADTAQFGDLNWSDSVTKEFTFRVAQETPVSTVISFVLELRADDAYQMSYTFRKITLSNNLSIKILEGYNAYNAPIIADINNDDKQEIVTALFSSENGSKLIVLDYTGSVVWEQTPSDSTNPSNKARISSFAVGDINNDGFQEIVTGILFEDGKAYLYIYHNNGHLEAVWFIGQFESSIPRLYLSLSDLNNDKCLDMVVAYLDSDRNPRIKTFNYRGEILWDKCITHFPTIPLIPVSPLVMGDVDNDGTVETGLDLLWGKIHLLSVDGTERQGWPVINENAYRGSIVMGDLDKDGKKEIINSFLTWTMLKPPDQWVCAYRPNGELLFSTLVGTNVFPSEAKESVLADLDNDGDLEIIVFTVPLEKDSGKKIYAFHHDGRPVLGWPVQYRGSISMQTFLPADVGEQPNLVVGDIDGDRNPEVLLVTYSRNEASFPEEQRNALIVQAWHRDGTPVAHFPLILPSENVGIENDSIAVGDIDNNGVAELILLGCERFEEDRRVSPSEWRSPQSYLTIIGLGIPYDSTTLQWPMFHHDPQHTGNYHTVTQPPAAPSNLVATAVSSSQINLSWRDNSSNENGFKVERSLNGISFTQIATPPRNTISYRNTGLAKGTTYYYRVRAYNSCGNSDYSNTVSVTTPQPPDLTVSDIKLYKPQSQERPEDEVIPKIGQLVTCKAILKNQGKSGTGIFNVKWFLDGRQVGYGSHAALGARETSNDNVRYDWTPTSGSHTLRFVADCDNHITESIETNNSFTKTVNIVGLKPDLVVTDIKFYKPQTEIETIPQPGQLVTCKAILKNQGKSGTGIFNVKWFLDGKQVGYGSHASLPPGQTSNGNVRYDWTPTSGSHTLRFVADCDNYILEFDENNNAFSKVVTVN